MRVSVVLALFNGERYLRPLLDSLRLQTQPAEEVLLLDDASTDDTVRLAERYIHEYRLSHWVLERGSRNLGYIRNFALGIGKSRGDVVFLCDQDDVWDPVKIETCLNVLDRHPDAVAVCTNVQIIDSQGMASSVPPSALSAMLGRLAERTPQGSVRRVSGTLLRPLPLLLENAAPGCTLAFRREVGEAYSAFKPHIIAHDWELCMIASVQGGLYFLNSPLVNYRLHDSNVTGLFNVAAAGHSYREQRLFLHGHIQRQFETLTKYHPYARRKAKRVSQLFASRGKMLSEKRCSDWLAMYRHPVLYARLFPTSAWLGDLAALLCREPGTGKIDP